MRLPPLPKLFAFRGSPKFTTDGCSGYMTWLWRVFSGRDPPWEGGCVIHDWYYWSNGAVWAKPGYAKRITRRGSDDFLFRYVWAKGYHVWAWLIWLGVRAGGSQYLPFSWRWRYRERWLDVVRGE